MGETVTPRAILTLYERKYREHEAALAAAGAALDTVARVRALVTAADADGSPLIDREAIRRALDGEADHG